MKRLNVKSLLTFVLLIMVIRLFLDLNYIYLISPHLSYAGLELNINFAKLYWSYFILLGVAAIIKKDDLSPSSFGILILTTFIVIPVTSLWALNNQTNGMLYIVVMSIFVVRLMVSGKNLKLPQVKNGRFFFLIIAAVITLSFFIPLIAKGGLNHINFSIQGTYDRRDYFYSNLANGYTGYFMAWFAKIINPALIAYFLLRRKFYLVALLFGLQVLEYSMTTLKAHLLFPMFVFFVFYVLSKQGDIKKWFLFSILLITLLCLLVGGLSENIILISLISRAFYSIAQNHFDYYTFFQTNDFVFWTNSFFNPFYTYSYNKPIAAIIGSGRYEEGVDAFANAGFIASGYSHLGAAGVLLYSMILGAILKLFDSLAKYVPQAFGLSISGLAIIQLVNTDLTTALLTHGIIIALLVLFLVGSSSGVNMRRFSFH